MRRLIRLILSGAVAGFVALIPNIAQADTDDVTVNLFGVEYAATSTVGSFAGFATTTTGQLAAFQTTIVHTALSSGGTATITGGTFTVRIGTKTLEGRYTGGEVGPGTVTPLFPGSAVFCKEVFPVQNVTLVGAGTTPIHDGTATGALTHVGFFEGAACNAFAASIKGQAMLS